MAGRGEIHVWIFVPSYKFPLASMAIHQSKLATGTLLICCEVCHCLNRCSLRVVRACGLLLLICSLFTSQQHCRSLCLSHVYSAPSALGSSHSDPNGFSLLTTFHKVCWDQDGISGHKSLLHKSQGSLRPAITAPSWACSPHAAMLFYL